MHACMYICMCMHACMHICMYACMNICMYICMHACMHVFMYACIYDQTGQGGRGLVWAGEAGGAERGTGTQANFQGFARVALPLLTGCARTKRRRSRRTQEYAAGHGQFVCVGSERVRMRTGRWPASGLRPGCIRAQPHRKPRRRAIAPGLRPGESAPARNTAGALRRAAARSDGELHRGHLTAGLFLRPPDRAGACGRIDPRQRARLQRKRERGRALGTRNGTRDAAQRLTPGSRSAGVTKALAGLRSARAATPACPRRARESAAAHPARRPAAPAHGRRGSAGRAAPRAQQRSAATAQGAGRAAAGCTRPCPHALIHTPRNPPRGGRASCAWMEAAWSWSRKWARSQTTELVQSLVVTAPNGFYFFSCCHHGDSPVGDSPG